MGLTGSVRMGGGGISELVHMCLFAIFAILSRMCHRMVGAEYRAQPFRGRSPGGGRALGQSSLVCFVYTAFTRMFASFTIVLLELSVSLPLFVFEVDFIFSLDMSVNSRSNLYTRFGGGRGRV